MISNYRNISDEKKLKAVNLLFCISSITCIASSAYMYFFYSRSMAMVLFVCAISLFFILALIGEKLDQRVKTRKMKEKEEYVFESLNTLTICSADHESYFHVKREDVDVIIENKNSCYKTADAWRILKSINNHWFVLTTEVRSNGYIDYTLKNISNDVAKKHIANDIELFKKHFSESVICLAV